VQLSRFWLRRFRFGPFEWLWRSLAYGWCQPMRVDPDSPQDWKWWTGRRVSRCTGIAIQVMAFPAVHALAPWALSLLAARHGWVGGKPSISNLVGLIPVMAGFYVFLLCTREHFMAAPTGWLLERTPHYPTPSYLLTSGPYRYSCNPIYLAELVIWLGWIAFYGSFVLAGTFAAVALLVGPIIVPREERGLEAKFGDAYREFRRRTPRWLGRTRR
jgi:protein-S-isoprenylcysteine O-methyltransferase Ste14